MTMNFEIIEGEKIHYNIEEVKKDYMNIKEYSTKDIRSKYNITRGQWPAVLNRLKNDGVPLRQHGPYAKYYTRINYPDRIKYRVNRQINGKMCYFGHFDTEEDAKKRVEELQDNGWNGLLGGG